MRWVVVAVALLSAPSALARAQALHTDEVVLANGEVLQGRVVRDGPDAVVVATVDGTVEHCAPDLVRSVSLASRDALASLALRDPDPVADAYVARPADGALAPCTAPAASLGEPDDDARCPLPWRLASLRVDDRADDGAWREPPAGVVTDPPDVDRSDEVARLVARLNAAAPVLPPDRGASHDDRGGPWVAVATALAVGTGLISVGFAEPRRSSVEPGTPGCYPRGLFSWWPRPPCPDFTPDGTLLLLGGIAIDVGALYGALRLVASSAPRSARTPRR